MAASSFIEVGFTQTGLGIKLSYGIAEWSGGNLIFAALIVWACLWFWAVPVLGLVAYIIVSIFAAPALVKMECPFEVSHFFIYFTTIFVYVTPPVAPAAIVAAKIGKTDYWPTAIEIMKVSAAAFITPLAFLYIPLMVLVPVNVAVESVKLIAFIVAILTVQVSFVGFT